MKKATLTDAQLNALLDEIADGIDRARAEFMKGIIWDDDDIAHYVPEPPAYDDDRAEFFDDSLEALTVRAYF